MAAAEAAEGVLSGDAIVLDGTVRIAKPRFDGDYRPVSGLPGWEGRHLPNSRHLDLLTRWVDPAKAFHFGAPDPAVLAAQLGEDGIDGTRAVIVYDTDAGPWASRLWWTLRDAGIDAAVLDGGLAAWEAAGLPVASGAESPPPAAVPAPPALTRGLWVTLAEARAISAGDAAGLLVCALGPGQFSGAEPTRYARRGHIPGSVNLPARSLADDDGRLLPPAGLAAAVSALGGVAGLDSPIVLYCGGGISACLTALALAHAGHTDVRIYDGSIEEWAADPDLPLVTSFKEPS